MTDLNSQLTDVQEAEHIEQPSPALLITTPPGATVVVDTNVENSLLHVIGDACTSPPSIAGTETQSTTPAGDSSTKVEVKERKRRIRIDDDDESPTFNPLVRSIRRGRGRGSRGSRGGRGANSLRHQSNLKMQRSGSIFLLNTPEKSHDSIIFTTPEGKVRSF